MRLIRILSLIGVKFFLLINIASGQDATFSQYYASSLYLNPAMAGITPAWTLAMNYRSQWRSVLDKHPYTTTQASLIAPFQSKNIKERHWGGAGISIFNDRAPIISATGDHASYATTGVNANFAYILPLSSMQNLIFGVNLGAIYKTIDNSALNWGTQYDPTAVGGYNGQLNNPASTDNLNSSKLMPDVGAGVLYYFNPGRDYETKGMSGFAGFSAYHLNAPNESLYKGNVRVLPVLMKAHAGVEVSLSKKINVSPNILLAFQNGVNQFNGGGYFTYMFAPQSEVYAPNVFILGGWYRLRDAAIISTGIGNDFYTLGFSYDLNSSDLRKVSGGRGAYEISLKITKPNPRKKTRYFTPRI